MSQFLIAASSLVVSLGYLSWLATWRRNVRLQRRLRRALEALHEQGSEEPTRSAEEPRALAATTHREAA